MENSTEKYCVMTNVDINGREEATYSVYDTTKDPWQEVSHPSGFETKAEAEEHMCTLRT